MGEEVRLTKSEIYINNMIKREEELVLGFIFNILTNNTVMNKWSWSMYGSIERGETIRLTDCINYIGSKLNLKDKQ